MAYNAYIYMSLKDRKFILINQNQKNEKPVTDH